MPLRFSVLASGSSGNACLLRVGDRGVLIDLGIGPRLLAQRLSAVDAGWRHVQAVFLTHTHRDHWKEKSLREVFRRQLPFYCHPYHQDYLASASSVFARMRSKGLVQSYHDGVDIALSARLRVRPLALRHDDRATFGFRFDIAGSLVQAARAVAYLADLGCWDLDLVQALREIDLLAVEFNHDVAMEESSGRSPRLVERVLGDNGHLSNAQAAELLSDVLRHSLPGRLQHLVQLHLSRECNSPDLALEAAREIRRRHGARFEIHTAFQFHVGPSLVLQGPPRDNPHHHGCWTKADAESLQLSPVQQRLLPGCE
jgi:phosphoribosyl 1,2-cyclic phosphodiesterase